MSSVPNGNREQLHIGFHWDCGLRVGNIEGQRCLELFDLLLDRL